MAESPSKLLDQQEPGKVSLLTILVMLATAIIGGGLGLYFFQILIDGQGSPRASQAFIDMMNQEPRMRMLATITFFVGGVAIAFSCLGLVAAIVRLRRFSSAQREIQQQRAVLAATAEQRREEFRETEYKSVMEGME